ncbi:MAG: cytochrome P450 [Aureispira sp.]
MSNKKEIPQVGLTTMLMNYGHINENIVTYFQQLLEEHDGLIKMKLPHSLILTDRPAIIEHVFKNNQKNYTKTKLTRELFRKQVGNGLVCSTGAYWLKQRRVIQPGFHRKRLQGIGEVMVEEISLYMKNTLDKYAENQQEIDLAHEMLTLAFKVITKSLFGQNFGDKELNFFRESIEFTLSYVVNQGRKPYLKPWYRINGTDAKNERLKKTRNEIILKFIEQRKNSDKQEDDLLNMLLNSKYKDGSGMTTQQLLDEIVILFIAGHETTGVSITWMLYLLGLHPDIEQKVFNSVQQTLGDKDPTFQDIPNLSYTLQVIQESMRLYPTAWYVEREALADDKIGDYSIKKGENIAFSAYNLHRNPKYWNKPDHFDPERFSPENKKKQFPFSYLPFGAGPRLCIGKNLAMMEMQFIVAMLTRRYKFTLLSKEISFKPLLTLCPSDGVKVRIQKR